MSDEPIEPVGVVDIAKRLGVRQQTVAMWRYRGLLPEAPWRVSNQPAWNWPDIRRWAEANGRLLPREEDQAPRGGGCGG
ncbi:MAG TPA: hypothetical protein VK988_07270 [Acidimicrobiales bacterium]|nr:hypothetical protein [Acidimicrobiales bacterium]